jgi:hypothetical protein
LHLEHPKEQHRHTKKHMASCESHSHTFLQGMELSDDEVCMPNGDEIDNIETRFNKLFRVVIDKQQKMSKTKHRIAIDKKTKRARRHMSAFVRKQIDECKHNANVKATKKEREVRIKSARHDKNAIVAPLMKKDEDETEDETESTDEEDFSFRWVYTD